jgi:hypothetical protein
MSFQTLSSLFYRLSAEPNHWHRVQYVVLCLSAFGYVDWVPLAAQPWTLVDVPDDLYSRTAAAFGAGGEPFKFGVEQMSKATRELFNLLTLERKYQLLSSCYLDRIFPHPPLKL